MRPALFQRVRDNLAALDRRLWLAVLLSGAAARLLTAAQNIVATPDPVLLAISLGLVCAAVAIGCAVPADRSLALALESFALFTASVAVLAPLSYVATRSPFPAIDGTLTAIDQALGFEAARARNTVSDSAVLSWVFAATYLSVFPQYLLALVVLPRTRAPRRGLMLMRMSMLTLCLSYVVVFLWPTIGTMPRSEAWGADWHALHDSRRFFDSCGQIQGIVSFPSYHAAMATMLAYSFRGLGALSWMVTALDALVLVVTPVMGFHHIADLGAGMVVAATSIALVDACSRRRIVARAAAPQAVRARPFPSPRVRPASGQNA